MALCAWSSWSALSFVFVLVVAALHCAANRALRKTTRHEKAHLLAAFFGILRNPVELAAPDFTGTCNFGFLQSGLELVELFALQTVLLEFGQHAAVAVAAGTAVHQRFGEPFLRQPVVL